MCFKIHRIFPHIIKKNFYSKQQCEICNIVIPLFLVNVKLNKMVVFLSTPIDYETKLDQFFLLPIPPKDESGFITIAQNSIS